MVEIHNLIQPGLEQIFLPALSTFFRSHPDIRCCFATSIESRRQRQINLQANLCPSRQNWQKRILTASENRFPLKRLRVLHGRLVKRPFVPQQLSTRAIDMPYEIDCWITLGSTYSYLTVMRVPQVAQSSGVQVRFR